MACYTVTPTHATDQMFFNNLMSKCVITTISTAAFKPNTFRPNVVSALYFPGAKQLFSTPNAAFRFPGKINPTGLLIPSYISASMGDVFTAAISPATLTHYTVSGNPYTIIDNTQINTTDYWIEFWINIDTYNRVTGMTPISGTTYRFYHFFDVYGFKLIQDYDDNCKTSTFYIIFRNDLQAVCSDNGLLCTQGFSLNKGVWHHIAINAKIDTYVNVYVNYQQITPSASLCFTSACHLPYRFITILFTQSYIAIDAYNNNVIRTINWGSALYKNIKIWTNDDNYLQNFCRDANIKPINKITLDTLRYFNSIDSLYAETNMPCNLIYWIAMNDRIDGKMVNIAVDNVNNTLAKRAFPYYFVYTASYTTTLDPRYTVYNLCPSGYVFDEDAFLVNSDSSFCVKCSSSCGDCDWKGTSTTYTCGATYMAHYTSKIYNVCKTCPKTYNNDYYGYSNGTCSTLNSTSRDTFILPTPNNTNSLKLSPDNITSTPLLTYSSVSTNNPVIFTTTPLSVFTVFFYYKLLGFNLQGGGTSSTNQYSGSIITLYDNTSANNHIFKYNLETQNFEIWYRINGILQVVTYTTNNNNPISSLLGQWVRIGFGFTSDGGRGSLMIRTNPIDVPDTDTTMPLIKNFTNGNTIQSISKLAHSTTSFGLIYKTYIYSSMILEIDSYVLSSSYSTDLVNIITSYDLFTVSSLAYTNVNPLLFLENTVNSNNKLVLADPCPVIGGKGTYFDKATGCTGNLILTFSVSNS
jgi:hypothetical protein